MFPPPLSLDALVERLTRFDEAAIALDPVAELISGVQLRESTLRPFLNFRSEKYTRNLVHRSPLFDVIVLCWRPGQGTPVHNHSGQLGWVRALRGRLAETTYAPVDEGARPAEWDGDRVVLSDVPLAETGSGVAPAGPGVVTVDAVRAIHRLGNPAEHAEDEEAVSLHVYSRPHDSCLVFDLERGSAERRELSFDTVPGAV